MAKSTKPVDARHYDVILAPHITEKSTLASENNAVVFKVAGGATKPQIKEAVEALFDVKVTDVRTMQMRRNEVARGRTRGTTARWKKAVVTLGDGQTLPVFEG